MNEKCENCKYAQNVDAKNKGYVCRRFPPSPTVVPQQNAITGEGSLTVQSYFPPVGPDNWCGEWSGDKWADLRLSDDGRPGWTPPGSPSA